MVLTFGFYYVPVLINTSCTFTPKTHVVVGDIPIDRLGNGNSKKLSDLFQGQLRFKCNAGSKVRALDTMLY